MNKDKRLKVVVIILSAIFIIKDFAPHFSIMVKYIENKKAKIEKIKKIEEDKKTLKCEYYPNGMIEKKSLNGITEYYSPNGVLEYIDRGDIKEHYDEAGKLIKEDDEKEKNINGEYKIYSPNGKILLDYNYKNGEFDGVQKKYFYNSSSLYSVREYKDGVPIGISKVYYPNGNIETMRDYENKIKEEYNIYGKLTSRESENKKIKIEEKRKYYDNQNLEYVIFYENGKRIPIGKEYYKNGKIKNNQYYDEKTKNLVAEEYYENGNFLSKTIYLGKDMYGEIIYYLENREDNSKYYEMKIKENKEIEKFFDKNGNVVYENIKETTYE